MTAPLDDLKDTDMLNELEACSTNFRIGSHTVKIVQGEATCPQCNQPTYLHPIINLPEPPNTDNPLLDEIQRLQAKLNSKDRKDVNNMVCLEFSDLQALVEQQVLIGRIKELEKHRRWFERMAEYADVKKDAMNEYDDEILTLKAQLKLIEEK